MKIYKYTFLLFFIICICFFTNAQKQDTIIVNKNKKDSILIKDLNVKRNIFFWRIKDFITKRKIVFKISSDTNASNVKHKNKNEIEKKVISETQKDKLDKNKKKPTNKQSIKIQKEIEKEKRKNLKEKKKKMDIDGNLYLKSGIGILEVIRYNNENYTWTEPLIIPLIIGSEIGVSQEFAIGTDINFVKKNSFDPNAPYGGYLLTDRQLSFSLHGKLYINSLYGKKLQPYSMFGINYIILNTFRKYGDGTPVTNPFIRSETTMFGGFVIRLGTEIMLFNNTGITVNFGLGISWCNIGMFLKF